MSRVITFSRFFPAYHPRKGESTYFVEAILAQLGIDYKTHHYFLWLVENNPGVGDWFLNEFYKSLSQDIDPKSHTVRAHKKPLKVGEFINPKCWAGKPYNKTKEGYWQIKFAPDIEIKKRWEITIVQVDKLLIIGDNNYYPLGYEETLKKLAANDGLTSEELKGWFNKPFEGQIISWNENINY